MCNALRVGGGCYSWGSFALLIGIGLGGSTDLMGGVVYQGFIEWLG